ncbi:MAG: PspC domain-containing protein [Nitriliruptor sp.]|nr:MAG: PspC domain-containing protein [Nitriliruptor sp.]
MVAQSGRGRQPGPPEPTPGGLRVAPGWSPIASALRDAHARGARCGSAAHRPQGHQEQVVDTSQVPPPPAGQPTSAGPPLRRPQEGRILAGVAAGLADHLGWDVALVRLLIVVATLVTQGLGLIAYLAAALLIPAAETGAPRPVTPPRSAGAIGGRPASFWLGVGLLVVGAWWLFAVTPLRFGLLPGVSLGSIGAPLLLIAFGLALWVTGDRAAGTSTPGGAGGGGPTPGAASAGRASAAPTTASTASAASAASSPSAAPLPFAATASRPSQEPAMNTVSDPAGYGDSATPPTPPADPTTQGGDWSPPPAPERSDSVLARATVGLTLVTVGVLWTLRLAGVLAVSAGQVLAAALLIVGLGLLVGAVMGRGRSLIWLGVVLLPFVLLAQVPGATWVGAMPVISSESAAAGELRLAPVEFDELQSRYELGAGSIRLDLTQLPFDGESIEVELAVGAGEIRVIVPDDVDVEATGSVGIGQVQILSRSAGGLGVGDVETTVEVDDPQGAIELELNAGLGDIRVDTAPAAVGRDG